MVKAIISAINKTPQKTYCIAQYTDSWYQSRSFIYWTTDVSRLKESRLKAASRERERP
jgi:hypothetical protein